MTRTEWGPERPRHTGKSKLIANDGIGGDLVEERRRIERQDAAFVTAMAKALRSGGETAKGALGRFRVTATTVVMPPVTPGWVNGIRESPLIRRTSSSWQPATFTGH
jgi:hypothetical protein